MDCDWSLRMEMGSRLPELPLLCWYGMVVSGRRVSRYGTHSLVPRQHRNHIRLSPTSILTSCQVGWGVVPVGYGAITGGVAENPKVGSARSRGRTARLRRDSPAKRFSKPR